MCPCSSKTVTSIKTWSCLARLLVDAMQASALGRLQGLCCAKLLYLRVIPLSATVESGASLGSPVKNVLLNPCGHWHQGITVLAFYQVSNRIDLKAAVWKVICGVRRHGNLSLHRPTSQPKNREGQRWHQATVVGHPIRGGPRPRSGKPGLIDQIKDLMMWWCDDVCICWKKKPQNKSLLLSYTVL